MSFDGNPVDRISDPSTVTWWLLPGRVGEGHRAIHDDPLAWLWVHSLLPRGSAGSQRIAVCSTPSNGRTPSPLRSRGAAHNTPDKEILPPGERRVLHSLRRACRASASAANQSAALFSSVSSVCHTVSRSATSLLSIERIRDFCKKEQLEALCRLTERGACGAADRADALL